VQVALQIQRSDPTSGNTWLDRFELEVPEEATLLDCLEEIKDAQDGTLAFRRSCRERICGSCAMRVDGVTVLACGTRVAEITSGGRVPTIAPIGNHDVVRDLVVDSSRMWKKMFAVRPYLVPDPAAQMDAGPACAEERAIAPELMEVLRKESLCINCGACLSECEAMTASPEFLGPQALAKAMRFVGDPRDGDSEKRLEELSGEHGIWECTRCYFCNERCPKRVDPRDAIAKLGAEAIERGIDKDRGAKHARWFVTSAKTTGWLRETELVPKTIGIFGALKEIRFALRLARHGKVPSPFPRHKARNVDQARKLAAIVAKQERRGAMGIVQGERALGRIEFMRSTSETGETPEASGEEAR